MPQKFTKRIIKPGTYKLRNGNEFDVTPEKVQSWANTFTRMRANGLEIPAPYFHDPNAQPVRDKETFQDQHSANNGGWWDRLWVGDDGWLTGDVEAATDADAEAIGTKVRDVSLVHHEKWADGTGNVFDDALSHIALVVHPVAKDDQGFLPAGSAFSLSASMALGDAEGEDDRSQLNSLESARALLADLGIDVGEDVTPENFIDRLCTAARAVKSYKDQEEGGEDFEQPPAGAKTQKPAPIAMSKFYEDPVQFALATVAEQPKNPATDKPWTPDEISKAHADHLAERPAAQFSLEQQAALDLLQSNNKGRVVERVRKCVKEMTMPNDVAKDIIAGINETTLCFSQDGMIDEAKHRDIFIPLKMAEASNKGAALTGQSRKTLKGAKFSLEEHPDDFEPADDQLSDEDASKLGDKMLASLGI